MARDKRTSEYTRGAIRGERRKVGTPPALASRVFRFSDVYSLARLSRAESWDYSQSNLNLIPVSILGLQLSAIVRAA